MQNAINEMHNNGIIASLSGEAANAVHDPDPDVRVREKTSLAKSVGKQFIPTTMPVPSQGGLSYLANLNYDSRFVNSITLCFQGGIEGLHMTFASNPNVKLDRIMAVFNIVFWQFTLVWLLLMRPEINAEAFLHQRSTIIFFVSQNAFYSMVLPNRKSGRGGNTGSGKL